MPLAESVTCGCHARWPRTATYPEPPVREGSLVDAAVWGFIGVVAGGILTVGGQATAELIKGKVATRERQDRRAQLSREFQRSTLIDVQAAMTAYRAALGRDGRQTVPSADSEEQLTAARATYQTLLHRVSSTTARDAVQAWEAEALRWFQKDDLGSAGRETTSWLEAMRQTGAAIRDTE